MEATTNVFSNGASPSQGYLPEQNPIIPISYFLGIHDAGEDPHFARERNQPVTWWQLVCLLGSYSQTPLTGKKDAPLFCPTVFRLDPQLKADEEPYDGPRNHLNATQSGAISVDLDEDCSFDFAEGWLRDTGVESLLYTTASHTIAKPRLRLLIPLAEPVDPATHLNVVKAIVNLILGRKLKDTSKSQCWSMFYFPAQYQSAEENRIAYVPGGFLTAQDWIDLGGVTDESKPPLTNGVDHRSDLLPLSRDAAWDCSEATERYLSMGKGSGRHVAFFGTLVSIAMKAIHAGYGLDASELAHIAGDLHRINPPSKPYRDFGRVAAEALDSARSKVGTPAYVMREEGYQRWWAQLQREMDDWEPAYPETWYEQARETVRKIQQMRQPPILQPEPEQPEPANDDDVDANPVHNFFGSLVPRSALTKDMLPTTIAENAWDEAERRGVTPDGIVMSNLMVCSGAISDAYKITPMLHNYRWKESARLWGLLIGDSGSKKTDQITPAAQPLVDLELRHRKQDDALMDEYDQAMAEYRAWQMNKDKAKDSDYEPEKPEKPRRRQFICNEFTMESLAPVLVDNTRGVIVINDEIAENLGSFDCYRAGGVKKDRAAALRLWNGGQWAINRVSTKDRPVLVENWSARYFGGIQPEKLAAMAPKLTDDGLLQRFLAAFSTNLGIGIDRVPNMEAIQDYHNLVESLATSNPTGEVIVRMSAESYACMRQMQELIEHLKNAPGVLPALKAHLSKLTGLFARLMLTLHLINSWEQRRLVTDFPLQASGAVAKQAYRLMVRFFIPNSIRVYEQFFENDNQAAQDVRNVAGYILAHSITKLTVREIGRAERVFTKDKSRRDAVIRALVDANWLTPITTKRKDSEAWAVNAIVHIQFAERAEIERKERAERQRKIAASGSGILKAWEEVE